MPRGSEHAHAARVRAKDWQQGRNHDGAQAELIRDSTCSKNVVSPASSAIFASSTVSESNRAPRPGASCTPQLPLASSELNRALAFTYMWREAQL